MPFSSSLVLLRLCEGLIRREVLTCSCFPNFIEFINPLLTFHFPLDNILHAWVEENFQTHYRSNINRKHVNHTASKQYFRFSVL